jgi:flagellar basal body P-ring formation protein FlgA
VPWERFAAVAACEGVSGLMRRDGGHAAAAANCRITAIRHLHEPWHGACFIEPMNRKSLPGVCFPALLALSPLLAGAAADTNSVQSVEKLQHWAEAFVRQKLQIPDTGTTIHVTASALDARLRLKPCTTALAGIMPANAVSTRLTVGVRCTNPAWTIYIPVIVETEMNVLVLRHAAARNTSLTAADVQVQPRRVPGIASSYLTSLEQLTGRHLKQAAGPGTALTNDLVVADMLIKRGQRVTLVANAGGIEVRAQGEAVADATPAGRVRVLNLSSRKIVEGQVETTDRVRVTL